MTFAEDQLSKGYLRKNMSTIVSKVKVREIIVHLPCLTDHDRETIEAKRETNGNYDGMVLLLQCLTRRENWPQQLIEALEACEQSSLAAEIRAEYDALRGVQKSNSSSSATAVVSAHVHPPPPESRGNSHGASAPPEPAAHASPSETSALPHATQTSAAQVPRAGSPPEPVPESSQPAQSEAAPLSSTPPPSPETPHTATHTPPPQREVNTYQEPEENSESDIQDISRVTSDGESPGRREVRVDSMVAPSPGRPVGQCETQSVQTSTAVTGVRPPLSPSSTQANSDVTDSSSFITLTPEKPPVQDTTPPAAKGFTVLETEGTNAPPATQVPKNKPQANAAPAAPPLPGVAVVGASLFDDDGMCLSKPGILVSIQPPSRDNATLPATDALVEPYSGNSARLEMSDAAPDTVTSAHVPAAVSPTAVNTTSGGPCQENGITLNHNEPEENHYDSLCPSLETQDVRVSVGHVSGEPSILNLDGQTSAPPAQTVVSEAAREMNSAPPFSSTAADTVSSSNSRSSESSRPSEPAPQPQSEENCSKALTTHTRYIITAAGVAALALLLAWKFKN